MANSFLKARSDGRHTEAPVAHTAPLPVATSTNTRIVTATIASGESASTAITLNPGERTSASDAALASLQSKGWTVTFA